MSIRSIEGDIFRLTDGCRRTHQTADGARLPLDEKSEQVENHEHDMIVQQCLKREQVINLLQCCQTRETWRLGNKAKERDCDPTKSLACTLDPGHEEEHLTEVYRIDWLRNEQDGNEPLETVHLSAGCPSWGRSVATRGRRCGLSHRGKIRLQ